MLTATSDTPEQSNALQPESNALEVYAPPRPTKPPPPPTVEEEDVVLKKEHGTFKSAVAEEEPNSRGDVEQNPVIMEVHEFNPERRFVILNEDPKEDPKDKGSSSGEQTRDANDDAAASNPQTAEDTARTPERREKPEPREEAPRRHRRTPSEAYDDNRSPQHHRSKSAATGTRPDYFSSRQSRQFGEQMLSPDVIVQGGGRREQRYYGYTDAPRRDHPSRDRYREGKNRSPPESAGRSANSSFESRSGRRPISSDRESDRRNRDYYPAGSYYDDKSFSQYGRSGNSSSKSSAKASRDHSRSNDEYSKSPRMPSNMRKPLVTKGDSNSTPAKTTASDEDVTKRLPLRTQTTPLPAVKAADTAKAAADGFRAPKPAMTFSVDGKEERATKNPLPYPEEDVFYIDPIDMPEAKRRPQEPKTAESKPEARNMRDIPPVVVADMKSNAGLDLADTSSATAESKTAPEPKPWKPPSFDPDRDGTRLERPVGAFRRYSESRDEAGAQKLPECTRIRPVAGKTDWLTLPRTDFNMCPGCYDALFSKSEYRTEFQPVLRPTVDAISCDFGSSPWYRIAWLLMVKNRDEDLRLFRHIASIGNASRSLRCPGERKTTREWYTVWDPYTRRPVPDFTVCYQCAKTVEALLPSLSGVFVPLDPKAEPARSICALHFTPDRKAFVLYFDSFETVAEKAAKTKKSPDMATLAQNLERLSTHNECREDRPITDGYWHFMQYIPDFTVCGDCFEDVVRPRLGEECVIARNFYMKPQRVPRAACQLYSSRMRDVFKRACRRNDPKYLEAKVRERRTIETSIKAKLAKLDREGQKDAWADKQIDGLIEEWKQWE
ncbi:hypothetical protein K4F52_009039 [Lecanicillium sp. MT-2017a]|nr:hypothetical protein K4F52_009039 [Lecanicillium sp. MT-2017a]